MFFYFFFIVIVKLLISDFNAFSTFLTMFYINGLQFLQCIYYIGFQLVCPNCGRFYTRTNRERHYRSYRCRVTMFIEFDLIILFKLF